MEQRNNLVLQGTETFSRGQLDNVALDNGSVVLDSVAGSAATLLAALLTARCQKKWLAPLPPVIANTVLIGLVLAYEQAGTSAAFWPTYAFNALTVGLGEAVACYGLGGLLLWRLDKSNALQRYLQNR